EFDDLLEVATQIYGCPMAAITFIDKDRQFFKARKGFGETITEMPRDISFCAHTILQNDVLLVKDAALDIRFCENPLVTDGLLVRFYAGAPIVSRAGYKLGSICVVDRQPRELMEEETKMLAILSQQVSKLLELRMKNKLLKKRAEEQLKLEKRLLHKVLLEQENSALQISTALHENIAQGLAATRFYLELAGEGSLAKDELIRKSRSNVELLVQQVRELSQAITPTTLREFCLEELLQNLLSHYYNNTATDATLIYEGTGQLPSAVAMAIYRIVEEQLKNIQQHARATTVVINLQVTKCVHLCIKDNGVGVDLKMFQKGIGIQKILSRVENLDGDVDFSGVPGGGCRLMITIPLQQSAVPSC
ncbi:MAG TPA: GAF domain-containing protein, partial [Flavisolibacter sp.]|nr:GAF domain-containing protein [Flavisolibacter sp.]